MLKLYQLLPRCSGCLKLSPKFRNLARGFCTKKSPVELEDINAPIKYSTSKACMYQAKTTRTGIAEERLWYEPYVILASITTFLLYFCVFREENDIDKELSVSLYSRIDGLEEYQLRLSLKYNLDRGLDTTAIRDRLAQIEEEKRQKNPDL
ncbi:uncharacterized protein LOC126737532 [Anthonomus grandis grandis]|uniref:uncharacterized protein LOC126737532 n=1 Tax=Anthonomus grandis grandis TaxID=2921223 RepID=UPI0021665D3F|nr:uncharacterized protein LOC126737532 [Anthonomus grandis grandis]